MYLFWNHYGINLTRVQHSHTSTVILLKKKSARPEMHWNHMSSHGPPLGGSVKALHNLGRFLESNYQTNETLCVTHCSAVFMQAALGHSVRTSKEIIESRKRDVKVENPVRASL